MKYKIIVLSIFALAFEAKALGLDLEPVIGYERVQKFRPVEQTVDRMIYGLRILIGVPLIKLEIEGTRGQDTATFTSPELTTKDLSDKVKIGLRSGLRLGRLLTLSGRGGVQAEQNTHTETAAGVATITKDPVVPKPYAGAGLKVKLNPKISLSGDVVAVFKQWPDMDKNEYQTTLGINVALGTMK